MKSKEEILNFFDNEAALGFCTNEYALRLKWYFATYYNEYAQQSQPSGMRWVRASERLPVLPHPLPKDNIDERGILFVNRYHSAGAFWYPSYGVSAISFLENYNGWDVTEWEWLYESSPAGAAEGASEGMAEALREIRNRLYDSLPTGEIDANASWEMLQSIKRHVNELDEFCASLSPGVEDNQTKKQ